LKGAHSIAAHPPLSNAIYALNKAETSNGFAFIATHLQNADETL
jgi:hypothetical protein